MGIIKSKKERTITEGYSGRDQEERRENFRMSKTSLLKLGEELRPYIEGKETIMRSPVDVVKQVALALYYLSDEGRL